MSDPFGAIATQAIGDLGIHIGNGQWATSTHVPDQVVATISSPGGKKELSPSGIYGFPAAGRRLNIYDGNLAHPVTEDRPSVYIQRVSEFSFTPAQDNALLVYSLMKGQHVNATGTAIRGVGLQYGMGDMVGVEGMAIIDYQNTNAGSHVAFGGFFNGVDFNGDGYTVGNNSANQVSNHRPYTAPGVVGSYSYLAQCSSVHYFGLTHTVTITINSPGVVTWTNHSFASGQRVTFTTTGALPTGITAATSYWLTVIDANTFHLSTSIANQVAGVFVNTSGSQSGVHTGAVDGLGADWRVGAAFCALGDTLGNAHYDIGFIASSGVSLAAFRDDTNAAISYDVRGSHMDGIDFTNATISGSQVKFQGGVSYTPTVTSTVGAFTTVTTTGHYMVLGKLLYFSVVINQVNAGIAAGTIQFSLPLSLTSRDGTALPGWNASTATSFPVGINTSSGVVQVLTAPATGQFLVISGFVEVA